MKPEDLKALQDRLAAVEGRMSKTETLFDATPVMRPTIIPPMMKVYESDMPLYTWLSNQSLPAIPLSVQRLYKVIDDLGPVFQTDGDTGAITPEEQAEGTCSNKIDINFCQRDYKAFRVAVEACVEDTDVDVPFTPNRDGQPEDGGVNTVGQYRDVRLGEAMRQAKDFLAAQGLGNANSEPESLETLVNQNTTPNIVDNFGQSAFEFALLALLAQIGLTTMSHSYLRGGADMALMVHPLVELTMSRRASLPALETMYSFNEATGTMTFMGISVVSDRNIYIDSETLLTSIFLVRTNHLGIIEYYDVDREVIRNEQTTAGEICDEDCKRLYNYFTGLARGIAKLGRVTNVKPMLVNTILSGHANSINQPNAGTTLGGTVV